MSQSAVNSMGMAPREFRIGSVISTSFGVYFKNIVIFTLVAGVIWLPMGLVMAYNIQAMDPNSGGDPSQAFIFIGLMAILGMLLQPISTAIILYSSFQDMRGKGARLGEAISWGLSRFFPILGLGILSALGIMAGLIALIVPGFILMMMWMVAVPACVVERTGPIDSLGRSAELTKGNRWQIFAIVLIVGLIVGFIGQILQGVSMAAGLVPFLVVTVVWQGISQAFNAVLVAVIYHDLRVTKEGIDIERIASVFD